MKTLKIFPYVGNFAENKDKARDIRIQEIIPVLGKGDDLITRL